ncbi:MAG TPA: hypothetical protein VMN37_02265 [Gemmatimonadales bacterium]|nr:hypothetical protein [Gemmatimonadales bacterium]
MNKVTIGFGVGLILGLVASYFVNVGNALGLISGALGIGLAGTLAGLYATRSTSLPLPVGVGALVGAVSWWYIGRGGATGTATALGAILGGLTGAIVAYRKPAAR